MTRVAVVVQRCHDSVVGGSEALAWQYARLLADRYEVEVLTSTATDYRSWENALPAGVDRRDGLAVRRFRVEVQRSAYWEALYHRMGGPLAALRSGTRPSWREALQDEFVRFQGPHCPELEAWLVHHHDRYAAIVFCTYLYPTTYFAIRAVPPSKAIVVPTLHDEPPAYLPAFAARYARYRQRVWLTAAEQRTAKRLWGFDEGDVFGMAVEHAQASEPEQRPRPYLLYCGRIDRAKGCDDLLQAYERLPCRRRFALTFTGEDNLGLPESPDIDYLGFVDESRKRALMAGARVFVLPSQYESFSIVTLEAMAQGTPVLVNGRCDVMREHIERSGGGLYYDSPDDMVAKLEQLCLLDADARARMGGDGRAYVLDNYREGRVREQLAGLVERVIARSGADAT